MWVVVIKRPPRDDKTKDTYCMLYVSPAWSVHSRSVTLRLCYYAAGNSGEILPVNCNCCQKGVLDNLRSTQGIFGATEPAYAGDIGAKEISLIDSNSCIVAAL